MLENLLRIRFAWSLSDATLRYSVDFLSKASRSTFSPSYSIATMQTPMHAATISKHKVKQITV